MLSVMLSVMLYIDVNMMLYIKSIKTFIRGQKTFIRGQPMPVVKMQGALDFIKKHHRILINIAVLLVIVVFLMTYFKPSLLFLDSTTTGGDTASHFYTAEYLKEYLLPHGKLSGWLPGNYAGMPLLQFYFSLPFLLMVLLSYAGIPLTIAFKLVSVLGIFGLPIAVFFMFRLMRFRFPAPVIAATASLLFLFHEANSMWGGNILSTLAGEFTYSISLALTMLFFGFLYRGISDGKYIVLNAILLFLIGTTHVYTLLLAVLCSAFFLVTKKNFKRSLIYLAKMHGLAFMLLAFFILPMLSKLGYTTAYNLKWIIYSWKEVLPTMLWPAAILALTQVGLFFFKGEEEKKITLYLVLPIVISALLFFFSAQLGVVDIRFIPFIQLFMVLLAADALGFVFKRMKATYIIPVVIIIVTLFWVGQHVANAGHWIQWNYEGFESKATWPTYKAINEFVAGDYTQPRVVFEHSQSHNKFGSSRAFESLPLFSGRSTLEGLYMQSSVSAPAVFFIQREISKEASCPFPNYNCGRIDVGKGIEHLELFNTNTIITVSEEIQSQLDNNSRAELAFSKGEYKVYNLDIEEGYVYVPPYEPVLLATELPEKVSYLWFIKDIDVPVAFVDKARETDETDRKHFSTVIRDEFLSDVPAVPVALPGQGCSIRETWMSQERFAFATNCIGLPHIVKMSYFPNWKAKGADSVYYVTPSFMLVYPDESEVLLYYGATGWDRFGALLTIIGIIVVIAALWLGKGSGKRSGKTLGKGGTAKKISTLVQPLDRLFTWIDRHRYVLLIAFIALVAVLVFLNHVAGKDEKLMQDRLSMEFAVALERYAQCEFAGSLRDECFIEIGKRTGDWNLCTARVSGKNKDRCYRDVGIATKDANLCQARIQNMAMRQECLDAISRQ